MSRHEEIEREVARAGRSSIDPRDAAAADLSPAAIEQRRRQPNGGWTGRQLVRVAADVFEIAKVNRQRSMTVDSRPRRKQHADAADEALRTAAAQIRLAAATPLDRPYLHALTLDKIQTVKAEVGRAFDENPGALALDTHRRIQDQRNRIRVEGVGS